LARVVRDFAGRRRWDHTISRKVIHIVENLDRGAVENWLVRMLRFGRENGIALDWTFYCALPRPGALDAHVQSLGAPIVFSPVLIGDKFRFMTALRSELRRNSYDVLHCHHDLVSAVYLAAAFGLPIDRCIVHVHNADESVLTPNPIKQRILRPLLRCICLSAADRIAGNSNHTLDYFLAGRARRKGRDVVHYYSVDPTPFVKARYDRAAFRRELGLPDDARILLFAGRMVPEKNPLFALDVLAQLRRFDPTAVGVFAGSGSLDGALGARADEFGLAGTFRALGWRGDLPEFMGCCDWFILPHPEHPPEGFGLAVVEAQLAGLRLLLSHGILDDPLLPHARVRRLALADGAQAWALAAMDLMAGPAPSRPDAFAALKASPMDMTHALDALLALHGQAPCAEGKSA
jgi:glycosyltransferase involved in cell wall biosynthesis